MTSPVAAASVWITLLVCVVLLLPSQVFCLSVGPWPLPKTVYAQAGSTARIEVNYTLNTGSDSETFKDAKWYAGGILIANVDLDGKLTTPQVDIPAKYRGRIGVELMKNKKRVTLLIQKVSAKDEVSYVCRLSSSQYTAESLPIPLKLSVGPPRPVIDTTESESDSITITWKTPVIKGIGSIKQYTVRVSTVDKYDTWEESYNTGSTALSYTVENLKADTEYQFRVSAWDNRGQGPESEMKVAKTGGSLSSGASAVLSGLGLYVQSYKRLLLYFS